MRLSQLPRYSLMILVALVASLPALFVHAQTINPNAEVEAKVRAAFADAPIMIQVAKCESNYRQFSATGVVLRGGTDNKYIGIFQISEQLHTATALALGHDIRTIDGNIGFARHLYQQSGTAPWRGCLPANTTVTTAPATVVPTTVSTTSTQLSIDLRLGLQHEQVRTLQKLLNAQGFSIATSGAGSLGQETSLFGSLTRSAVRRFQCAKNIICTGDESTTGFGRVGPKTRAALLLALNQ